MNAAHTPGPWRLDPPSMEHVTDREYHSIVAGDGVDAGRFKGFTISAFVSIEDARLIAAAPELLGALEEALEFIENHVDMSDGPDGQPQPNRAMSLAPSLIAAIAKATGSAA